MGCIHPKPKDDAKPPEKVKSREIIRRESQRPWNRNSNQIYCGDPKKGAKDENKQTYDEKQNDGGVDGGNDSAALVGVNVNNNHENTGIDKKTGIDNLGADHYLGVNNANLALVHKDFWDEMKFTVPRIVKPSSAVDQPLQLFPPPACAPFDPTSVRIIKRPRSVDAVLNHSDRPVNRARPLSYSPGLIQKTKHPRCLHSIEEIPKFRERPKSIDFSLFLQGDKDNNIQKLKRLLTQKSPRKSKTHPDHYILDRLILQPNQIKCIEEGPIRCFQPSQMLTRKKKNRDFKLKEVEYLRRVIGRPRMKFSKSLDILIQRCLQYSEYDPFLDQLAAQPSNPWLSDDSTFWDINKLLVDIPTATRMKKWALSFDDLLADPTGINEFELFLKKEYSHENIRFYRACKELISAPLSRVKDIKAHIENDFLTHGALCEVNIDAKTMELVRGNGNSEKDVNRFMFQPAMEHVYALMKKDSYTRFIRSEEYNLLMQDAQSHFTKKRNLFFGGSNKKKNTQSPSPQPRRRGSASSDQQIPSDTEIGGVSYHSYSTGNLRELDDKPKKAYRTSNSPSLRRRTDEDGGKRIDNDIRRRSNLDVPRLSSYAANSAQDPNRKSEAMSQCLALAVPGKTNIVTPWDGQQTN